MALDKRKRAAMRALCGEIHEDDGVDPREFFRANPLRNHKPDRKAQQLCRQVAETLSQVFAGELNDELLVTLHVVSVAPAPDASRMLVTLSADCEPLDFDRPAIEARLSACKGQLRSEVAAAITRRKAPTLAFNVIGPDAPAVGGEGA